MRLKTEARRTAMAAAAWEVFCRNGFERITIDDVIEIIGGSKATLYGYFNSKEALFEAALVYGLRRANEAPLLTLARSGSLRQRLLAFAREDLKMSLSPACVAVERILRSKSDELRSFADCPMPAPRNCRHAQNRNGEWIAQAVKPAQGRS